MSESSIKYYPFGLNGLNWLKVNGNKYYQSEELENGLIREIECDNEEKWMKVRTKYEDESDWHEINLNKLIKHDIIDLCENGDRWEGDSLDHYPFGFGSIYNSENQLIYCGFMFEGLKVCYGVELYGDVGLVKYKGGFYNGMRYGDGKLYNKKDELIYGGEWYMHNAINERRRIVKEEDIHFGLEEIVITNKWISNFKRVCFTNYHHLKKLVIHDIPKEMKEFRIENCDELIDLQLYAMSDDYDDFDYENSLVSFKNCKELIKLIIGNNLLSNCKTCEIRS